MLFASGEKKAKARGSDKRRDRPGEHEEDGSKYVQRLAVDYLYGKAPLSDAVLVGLHQGLRDRQLVARVVDAGKTGARLAADVPADGRSLRKIVSDGRFEWQPRAARDAPAVKTDPVCSTADDDRKARQKLRLDTLRPMRAAAEAAFSVLDRLLPATPSYLAYTLARNSVMRDIATALLEVQNIHADACPDLDRASRRLEQAQLWLYLLPPYAGLAAIVRAASTDRLPVQVTWSATKEADGYARAFTAIDRGAPTELAAVRAEAPAALAHTRALMVELKAALQKGQRGIDKVQKVEQVIDLPLSLAEGIEVEPAALFADLVVDVMGFYIAHEAAVNAAIEGGMVFFPELTYLYANSPLLTEHFLRPTLHKLLWNALKSINRKDVAFILGRTIRLVIAHDAAGSFVAVFKWLATATALVTALDSPLLLTDGAARLGEDATDDAEAILRDPARRAAFAAQLGKELPPDELRALIKELIANRQHIKRMVAGGEMMTPPLAALVADIQGEGKATEAQSDVMLSNLQLPLLDPAP